MPDEEVYQDNSGLARTSSGIAMLQLPVAVRLLFGLSLAYDCVSGQPHIDALLVLFCVRCRED